MLGEFLLGVQLTCVENVNIIDNHVRYSTHTSKMNHKAYINF